MNGDPSLLVHALGVGFGLLAVIAAFGVVMTRAHFATALLVGATSVLAALALVCFGAGGAAFAVALVGAAIVPVLMLGGVLLSVRAMRGGAGGRRLTAIAAVLAAAALLWSTLDAAPMVAHVESTLGVGAWLAALLFAAALVCAGVLGYGERGALMRRSRGGA